MRAAVAAAMLLSASACAAFDLPRDLGELSTTLTFATDYDYRGMSLTQRKPAGQASVDWALSPGPFVGIWTSNVDFVGDGPSIELDYYGGLEATLADTDVSATFLYYTYPVLADVESYPELNFQADRDVGPFRLDAFLAYTWDLNGLESQGVYPRFTAKLPLPWDLQLATHVGWQWASHRTRIGTPSYFDWSFGVRWEVWGVQLTLAYVDTDLSRAACGGTNDCSARPVFTASRTFSTGLRAEERRDQVGRGY